MVCSPPVTISEPVCERCLPCLPRPASKTKTNSVRRLGRKKWKRTKNKQTTKPTKLHECNLQPPSDKTWPRLFVDRLGRPTGAPLTPLALLSCAAALRISDLRIFLIFFAFSLSSSASRRAASHLPPSWRQGPPGSLLCPPVRPLISPTPPLGGRSSGGPTRGLSSLAPPSNTLFQTADSHSWRTPRHDTARPGPLHLHQPSLLSHFQHAALTPALSFQKFNPPHLLL